MFHLFSQKNPSPKINQKSKHNPLCIASNLLLMNIIKVRHIHLIFLANNMKIN